MRTLWENPLVQGAILSAIVALFGYLALLFKSLGAKLELVKTKVALAQADITEVKDIADKTEKLVNSQRSEMKSDLDTVKTKLDMATSIAITKLEESASKDLEYQKALTDKDIIIADLTRALEQRRLR
jgi:hypothetical protein